LDHDEGQLGVPETGALRVLRKPKMSIVRRALFLSVIERYALIVLGLVSYVLVARLLTPYEIGIYSVTAALVGVVHVIRDFGVSSYLIQEQELTAERRDTALGLSLLTGGTLFVLVFAVAPWVAALYEDPRMASILRVVSLNLLLLPFCGIALSLLRREMRFGQLLWVNILAGVVGFLVTIGLAAAGLGPESLAWGIVACNAVTACGAWWAVPESERPKRPRLVEWAHLLRFGRPNTLAGVVVVASMDINDLVVGKVLGFAPVAILSRAMGLMQLFHRDLMGAVRNVAYPAFAAAFRRGEALEANYVRSYGLVVGLAWPFYGFLALFPLEILRLLAGPQWDAAVPYVIVFAAAGAVIATATLTQTVVMAIGRVDLASRADLIVALIRVALAVVAAVVLRDLMAVAVALLLAYLVAVPVFYAYKQRCLPNDWAALAQQSARSLAVAAVCLALPAAVSLSLGWSRTEPLPLPYFLATCALALVGWLVAVKLCRHVIAHEPLYEKAMSRIFRPRAA
jgi:lipopolysaccharide exporter